LTTSLAQPADFRPPAWSFPLRLFGPIVAGIAMALIMQYAMLPAAKGYGTLVVFAGINIILGVSLTIVNGFTGQFSIGHAGFMALGAYAASAIVYYGSYKLYGDANFHGGRLSFVGGDPGSGRLLDSGDLLFVGACLFAGIIAAIAGWIVGLPSLRLRGDYLAIVTLGFGEIVRVVLQGTDAQLMSVADVASVHWWQLPNKLGGALGFIFLPTYATAFWIYVWVAIMLTVAIRLKYSSYGRALLSIREDEIAAQAVGVNITKYKVRAFVLSSFFAGVAGALYALSIGSINAGDMGFQKSFEILIIVVLGGLGSISGTTIAAIILTILPELLRSVDRYRMIFYALALIVMMIVRPQGLLGVREVWDVARAMRERRRSRARGFAVESPPP
jgi:branched-chain amino acid transport system permease protein